MTAHPRPRTLLASVSLLAVVTAGLSGCERGSLGAGPTGREQDIPADRADADAAPRGSAEAYDIDDVQWAMRLTHSGEFIHAAPWSVGSQGSANVSHGCTGMSTADAGWLYAMTRRGDVVETVGTDGEDMTLTNGWGDWNVPFSEYRKGSALA